MDREHDANDADAAVGQRLPPTQSVHALKDPTHDAMLTDIAVLALRGGMKKQEIAEQIGITPRHLLRLTQQPAFIEIYTRMKDEIYGDVTKVVVDEKTDIMVRAQAQMIRGQTLLAETTELLRGRVATEREGGEQMAAMALRVAVEAAKTAISNPHLLPRAGADGAKVQVNIFQPNHTQAKTMKEAMTESGIDLSDLVAYIPAKPVLDAEVIDENSEPDSDPVSPERDSAHETKVADRFTSKGHDDPAPTPDQGNAVDSGSPDTTPARDEK